MVESADDSASNSNKVALNASRDCNVTVTGHMDVVAHAANWTHKTGIMSHDWT